MKKIILAMILVANFANAQQAKVSKSNGIDVYIMNEPVRKYEVVIGKGNSIKWSSMLTGGLVNESINTKVGQFAKGILKQAKEENVQVDALIYSDGKSVVGVKFTEPATPENDGIATVAKLDGFPVYVMCEPLQKYNVVSDKGPGIKYKSMFTAGLVNNSIEQDMDKYIGRFRGQLKKDKIDAVLYTSGKTAVGIKFE